MDHPGGSAHAHHHGVDLASRPQILGDVNTGHIVGHLVPGLALFVAGCCLTHVVCSEVMVKRRYSYSALESGEMHGKEFEVGGVSEEGESVFLFYRHGPRYEERPTDLFKLRLGVMAVIFLVIGILLEGRLVVEVGMDWKMVWEINWGFGVRVWRRVCRAWVLLSGEFAAGLQDLISFGYPSV